MFGSLLIGWALPVLAQSADGSSARESFERGYEAARRGDLELAISAFEQAYATSPNFSVLYNLGQAYASAGRAVEAVDTLERYLELGGMAISEERRSQVQALVAYHAQRVGELSLTVHPAGAAIMLDGKLLGHAPLTETVRAVAGTHGLVVSLEGYEPSFLGVRVEGRSANAVRVALEPVAGSGGLHVRCGVPDVEVRIDGERVGRTPLKKAARLRAAATHRVTFERPGYLSVSRRVSASPNSVHTLDCGILPDPKSPGGRVRIEHPAGTEVAIDGAPFVGRALPAGRHVVTVTGPGFERLEREIVVSSSAPSRLTLVPKRTSPALSRERQSRADTQRRVSYLIGGAGLATGVAAAVLQIANEQRWADWRADTRRFTADYVEEPASASPRRLDELMEVENSLRNRDAVALGLGVLAGALLGVATLGYFTAEPSEPQLTVTPSVARRFTLDLRW